MFCPLCGSENRDNAKFCSECGRSLEAFQVAIDSSRGNGHFQNSNASGSPDISLPDISAAKIPHLSEDDYCVNGVYVPPVVTWKPEDTQTMKPIGESAERAYYRAPYMSLREKRRREREAARDIKKLERLEKKHAQEIASLSSILPDPEEENDISKQTTDRMPDISSFYDNSITGESESFYYDEMDADKKSDSVSSGLFGEVVYGNTDEKARFLDPVAVNSGADMESGSFDLESEQSPLNNTDTVESVQGSFESAQEDYYFEENKENCVSPESCEDEDAHEKQNGYKDGLVETEQLKGLETEELPLEVEKDQFVEDNDNKSKAVSSYASVSEIRENEAPFEESSEKAFQSVFSEQESEHSGQAVLSNKKPITIAIIAVVAILLAVFFAFQFEVIGGKVIPDVSGLTQTDATYTLQNKGFTVSVVQDKSDEIEGIVLSSDPGKGSRLKEGSEVVIHVATSRSIPQVVGKTREEAEQLFAAEGITSVTYVEERTYDGSGLVLSVSPEENSKVNNGTEIVVKVSVPYVVPKVSNLSQKDAVAKLVECGYNVVLAYEKRDDITPGTIIGVTPQEGSTLYPGNTVTLTVAKTRAYELEMVARDFLSAGEPIYINGTYYLITSVDSITYKGDDTTEFTVTCSAVTSLDGEVVAGSSKQRTGVITWTEDDIVQSITFK